MIEEAWDRLTQYARSVLSRPRFDEGYRDWKPAVASAVRALLDERDPARWNAGLEAILPARGNFHEYRYDLPNPRQSNWVKRWARLDAPSLWRALNAFSDLGRSPIERFAAFASEAENVPPEARIPPDGALVMGSFFNFALAPEALPMVLRQPLMRMKRALGLEVELDAPATRFYADSLDFSERVRERMVNDRLPIRDMIDVQSLIFVAGYESDWWAPEGDETRARRRSDGSSREAVPYLSICAIYRDEAEDLREWIEFHRLVGVERFFLYDNGSTDRHLDVLAPYIDRGIVVHHDWPRFPGQFEAYDHCLTEHRKDSRWIAFLDVDEFLFSPLAATVSDLLVDYEQCPAVGVNQMMFGTSGHRARPPGLVIEEHSRRDSRPWPFIKNIVDPRRATRCLNAHAFAYDYGTAVDENHQPIVYKAGRTQFTSVSRLRINHYYLKSEADGRAKLARQMAVGGTRPFDFDTLDRELNAEIDETITRYVPALRDALAMVVGERGGAWLPDVHLEPGP